MLLQFIILAVVLWAVVEYLAPKLPPPIGTVVTIVVVLMAIFWILQLFFPGVGNLNLR